MSVTDNLQKIVVLCVVAVVVIGGGTWLYFNQDGGEDGDQVVCTADAKECPDGSYVGRVAPDCEFAQCPSVEVSDEPSENEVDSNTEESETAIPEEWSVYTNSEWKYSFEYPKNYTLLEEANGFKVSVTPPEGFEGAGSWFSVVVIQYPDVEDVEMIPETLFHLANYPDGKVAWLKDWKFYDYSKYLLEIKEITFGKNVNRQAFKVRETSINSKLGEYRSLVYVLRDPAVYRITHDLKSEEKYKDVLMRIENSFEVF